MGRRPDRRAVRRIAVCLLACVLAWGCDEGLRPPPGGSPPVASGTMTGTIRFFHWDSAGTVLDLRLVAFRVFPPRNIVQEVLEGRARVYPPLGGPQLSRRGEDSVTYAFTFPSGTYAYVAVAQQFGPDVMSDWRAVGQYDLDTVLAVPSPVTIIADSVLAGVDIRVDFIDLPPPPFR